MVSAEHVSAAAASIAARIEHARLSPLHFFEFVAREEHTRLRIEAAPHQRVMLSFICAHPRSVLRIFAGGSKTFILGHLGLHLLGSDRTGRGAVIGATSGSAAKVLTVLRDPIENTRREFPELRAVFPTLRPSPLRSDPWGRNRITVDRPAGIRDPSFVAQGFKSDLPGARLKWIIGDDLLDEDNTRTPEARAAFAKDFGRRVLTRLDVRDALIVLANTPWDPDDLTYLLERACWPTLTMEVEGEVSYQSDRGWVSDELRPSTSNREPLKRVPIPGGGELLVSGPMRLAAHDSAKYGAPLVEYVSEGVARPVREGEEPPAGARVGRLDFREEIPLWPEKFSVEAIAEIKRSFAATPGEYLTKYRCRPPAPLDADKRAELFRQCKANGVADGHRFLLTSYRGPNPTFTGVDVGTSLSPGSDRRAIFTIEQVPELRLTVGGRPRVIRNARRLIGLSSGHWSGQEFVERLREALNAYGSIGRVESNAAQDLVRQWAVSLDSALAIEAHFTGAANKHHRIHGVAGVLIELQNLGWVLPCDPESGLAPPEVEAWGAELLGYLPERHPGDRLMASWLAREQARSVLGDRAIPYDLASVADRFR